MKKNKKLFIVLGIVIALIVIWRVNTTMNMPPISPSVGSGGVYDEKTGKFYTVEDMKKITKEREGN